MKQLVLADDGRVIIRTRTDEWILERPTLGELRKLVELAGSADERFAEAVNAVPEDAPDRAAKQVAVSEALQFGPDALYGQLVREFVTMLCEKDPPDIDDLPAWAVSGRAASRMLAHWRSVPLDLGPSE